MRWALFWVTRREERLLAPFDLISSCSAYLQHLAKYDVFLCPKERLSLWGEISRCSVQISDSYLGRPHWTSLWTGESEDLLEVDEHDTDTVDIPSLCVQILVILCSICQASLWSIAFQPKTSKYRIRIQKTTLFWLTIEKLFSTQWK